MKAINTFYKGYYFRSRLEARWAIYFDELNINWLYEDEGYELSNGTWYLPDFYLPTFNGGMFVEVKHEFTKDERQKCRDLCFESGKDVWLAEGLPEERAYIYLSKNKQEENSVVYSCGIPNHDKAFNQDRMFADPDYDGMMLSYKIPEKYIIYGAVRAAVSTAKQARFEHIK